MDNVKNFVSDLLHTGGIAAAAVDVLEEISTNADTGQALLHGLDWKVLVGAVAIALARVIKTETAA